MGRRLGQHFLIRESILNKIADASAGERPNVVVEIGPGKGGLTRRLLESAASVIAIEVDPYLAGYLRSKFRDGRLVVVEDDVLKTDLGQWGPAVIVGNLPYYITSPIISRVFETPGWQRAVFLVQKEVADRITALPGSRDYGYLTVHVAMHSRAEFLFPVSSAAFAPPPKVESAVVRLTPRDPDIADRSSFLEFARQAFRQKRKTLRNNLRENYPRIGEVPEAGLRAEQLGIAELSELFTKLTANH